MGISRRRLSRTNSSPAEAVAGNGLLHRRALLGRGIILAGSLTGAAAEPPEP